MRDQLGGALVAGVCACLVAVCSDKATSQAGVDQVAASVAAYSDHADEYEAAHAMKMLGAVERFARSLPSPSLVLDAGWGPAVTLPASPLLVTLSGASTSTPSLSPRPTPTPPRGSSTCASRDRFPAEMFDGIWAHASLVHLLPAEASDVLRQFAGLLRPAGKLYVCVKAVGETGWLDGPPRSALLHRVEPRTFAATVANSGFHVDGVDRGLFVELWATCTR